MEYYSALKIWLVFVFVFIFHFEVSTLTKSIPRKYSHFSSTKCHGHVKKPVYLTSFATILSGKVKWAGVCHKMHIKFIYKNDHNVILNETIMQSVFYLLTNNWIK